MAFDTIKSTLLSVMSRFSGEAAQSERRARAAGLLPQMNKSLEGIRRGNMDKADFDAIGGDLLAFWRSDTVEGPITELKDILRAEGFTPGTIGGARSDDSKCRGRYISVSVKDPVFGNFMARIWFLADWEQGLKLVLGAYRPVKPAQLMKYPPDVEPNALALVTLGQTRMDWSSMTLTEAKSTLWQWQKGVLEAGAAGSIGTHWPTLRVALEAARAP